jgi:hypothetical protein
MITAITIAGDGTVATTWLAYKVSLTPVKTSSPVLLTPGEKDFEFFFKYVLISSVVLIYLAF